MKTFRISDGARLFLYYGALIAVGASTKLWLIPWLDGHVSTKITLRVSAVLALAFLWAFTWLFYHFWNYHRVKWSQSAWKAAIYFTLAAIWIGLLVVVHVGVAQLLFGTIPSRVEPVIVQEPRGLGVAVFGTIMLLCSFVYLYFLVRDKDSFWAERFLHFRVFALWFNAGICLILISRVLDRVIGATFGEKVLQRIDALSKGDPKYSLIVGIPAIVLASVVTLWYSWKR